MELDSNKDGALTEKEVLSECPDIRFRKMDADGDGKINRQEFSRYVSRVIRQ